MSGKSVTVVDPAVWEKALLKARKETIVRPLKKNNPPRVTIKEAIPVFTINHPWNQPKDNVKHKVINKAVRGETSVISNIFKVSKCNPPAKDI